MRIHLLNALQIQQLSQPGLNFRYVLWLGDVREIERLYDFFFIIAAFLGLVRNYKKRVFRHRLNERLALQRHDLQRLLERDIVEIHIDAPRREVRVVDKR